MVSSTAAVGASFDVVSASHVEEKCRCEDVTFLFYKMSSLQYQHAQTVGAVWTGQLPGGCRKDSVNKELTMLGAN